MAKTIKGITVEIGGNTAPLQKSLQDVNKSTADIKSELREVDKLLKLDPGNTTLLAQKQELLGKQVGTTTEKLKRLKNVQEQVNKQFAEGKIDEGQYRAFQRELAKTESELKKVEDQADDTGEEVEDAGKKAKKSGDHAEDGRSKWAKFGDALKKIGSTASKAFDTIGGVITDSGRSFLDLAESTRETRTNMGKLETAFTTAGHSADAAKDTYTELYGILGDDGQATEAAAHLAKLADSEQDLNKWTNICTGVYATFGDSLPIEGLTEAANETAKTGELTGSLADALNWAGVNEDDFKEKLEACNTEQERQKLITDTLSGLYSSAASKYKAVNKEIIEGQKATAQLNQVMAQLGEVAEPVVTKLKQLLSGFLEQILPFVKQIGEGLTGIIDGTEGAAEKLADGFAGILGTIAQAALDMLPQLAEIGIKIVEALGSSFLEAGPTLIPQVIETLSQVIQAVITSLAEAAPTLIPAIVDMVGVAITAILEQLPAILEAVMQLVEGVAVGLIEAVPVIVEHLPEIVQGIVDAIVQLIPAFYECAIAIVTALVDALPEIIQGLVDALPDIITAIVDGLGELIPQIIECGITLFMALIEGLPDAIVAICEALPQIVEAIATGIVSLNIKIAEAGVKLLGSLITKLPEIIRKVVEAKNKIVDALVKGFLGAVDKIGEVGFKLFVSLVQKGSEIGAQIKEFAGNLMQQLIDKIRSCFEAFKDIGRKIVTGIWDGIKSGWDWLIGKVRDVANSLLDAAKDALGIHSPSRAFRDDVGKMMAAGIGEGFDMESVKTFGKIKSNLKAAEKQLAASVTNNTSTVNHNTSMGGIVVNVTGNVSTPAEARQIGDTIAERVQRGLRYKGVLSLA